MTPWTAEQKRELAQALKSGAVSRSALGFLAGRGLDPRPGETDEEFVALASLCRAPLPPSPPPEPLTVPWSEVDAAAKDAARLGCLRERCRRLVEAALFADLWGSP